MKKLLVFIFLLSIVGSQTYAEQINEQQALQIATEFMNGTGSTNSHRKKMTLPHKTFTLSHVLRSADGVPNLYIYNAEGKDNGFVIVSGDSNTDAIVLGYSYTGCFDYENGPEAARALLQNYSLGIDSLRMAGTQTSKASNIRKTSSDEIIEPLIKTQWEQSAPYNDLCPEGCPTGCIATAMAQVMKYWNWPEQGQGKHTNANYPTQTVDFSESHYDWEHMEDTYTSYSSDVAKTAVAKLMYDCGCSVDMWYDPSGSGSNLGRVRDALSWYFKYQECFAIARDLYDGDWEELLLSELREKRPVLYDGCPDNVSAGHTFICDGYSGNGYFHVNFGWGGDDGYYKIEGLPFKIGQGALVGICPDYEEKAVVLNGLLYNRLDESHVSLYACLVPDKSMVIPEYVEINGKKCEVTDIHENAFLQCTDLIDVTINASCIGDLAFYGCTNLTNVTLGNTVTSIGELAFAYCTNLSNVTINSNNIGGWAFVGCTSLTNVTIPSSVTSIGTNPFQDCPIEKLNWDSELSPYVVTQYCRTTLNEVVLGPNVTSIGDWAFSGCSSLKSFTIPYSVTSISEVAFWNTPIEKLTWDSDLSPHVVTQYCRTTLNEVVLGTNMTRIGENAFYECSSLTSLTIPSSIASIEIDAFLECPLSKIYVSWDTPIYVERGAFSNYDGTLYVPIGTKELYSSTYPWSEFREIEEYDAVGVHTPKANRNLHEVGRYGLDGTAVNGNRKGIHIIKMNDGSTRKVMVK